MLYDSDHIQDSKKAEAANEAAVELSLKELQYRQSLGFPINGGDGDDVLNKDYLTQTEATIALIRLADNYVQSESNNVELAIPLYLRALELIRAEEGPKASCKQVLLMTNLATAMGARSQLPFRVQDPDAARIQTSDAARQWALKAVEVYGKLPDSEKDDDCHLCRAAALNWLGQFAEYSGKLEEASKWYNDSLAGLKKSAQGSDYPDYRMVIGDTEKSVKRASEKLAGK
jgi:tetratricopeptide (TPR) repeat protein